MPSRCASVAVASMMVLLATACTRQTSPFLDLATTTSVKNSGLLDAILPAFEGARVRVHAAGSGRALEMLSDEVVDVVITHAPAAERRYLADHPDWRYRKFAFNRFVVVGPREDPAGVRDAVDAVDAFRRIAASPMVFLSRGDGSGTHEREVELWKAAGVKPSGEHLLISGANMATALRQTDERQGYTLADEATFLQLAPRLELIAFKSADPGLHNTYAVIHPAANAIARRFADWLAVGEGRRRVEGHQLAGRPLFSVWPEGCAAITPDAQPCAGNSDR